VAGIFSRLVEEFQRQEDERKRKEREIPPEQRVAVLPLHPLDGWKVLKMDYLPPRTLMVSPDVWDELCKHTEKKVGE